MLSQTNSNVSSNAGAAQIEVKEDEPPPLEDMSSLFTLLQNKNPSTFSKKVEIKNQLTKKQVSQQIPSSCASKSEGYLGLKKGFYDFKNVNESKPKQQEKEPKNLEKKKEDLEIVKPTSRPLVIHEVQKAMQQTDLSYRSEHFLNALETNSELCEWLQTSSELIQVLSKGGPLALQAWNQASERDKKMLRQCMQHLGSTFPTFKEEDLHVDKVLSLSICKSSSSSSSSTKAITSSTKSTDTTRESKLLQRVQTDPKLQEAMLDPIICEYLKSVSQGVVFKNMEALKKPEIQEKLKLLIQEGIVELQAS